MKLKRGVYYFDSRKAARNWADMNAWPADRVIEYGLGFAVQVAISGPYAGPDHAAVLARYNPAAA